MVSPTMRAVKSPLGRLIDAHHEEHLPFYRTLPFAWNSVMEQRQADRNSAETDAQRYRRSAQPEQHGYYVDHSIVQECCENVCSMKQMLSYCR